MTWMLLLFFSKMLFADGRRETPPMMSKEDLADIILDRLLAMQQSGQ